MALNFDYARLREETMTSGQDSAVTVNTRALIDKVLARYSSEFTTLRELIQNAADARATKVSIKFETLPSTSVPVPQDANGSAYLRHVIKHHSVRRLLVSNNGQPFSGADWARLKSIADGNPDETKIGAFGVGFYSVFADCDEPFVVSGDKTMAFFWKGNQLFTRAGAIPSEKASSETCFALEYRRPISGGEGNSAAIPDLMSLCQFLSTSLTFVGLETMELSIDEWNIATFRKKSSPPANVPFPRYLETTTEKGLMVVQSITSQTSQIDASWIDAVGWVRDPAKSRREKEKAESILPAKSFKSFLARLTIGSASSGADAKKQEKAESIPSLDEEDILGRSQASVFVQTVTVDVRTKVPSTLARELERATKKPPPKATRISVLTTSFGDSSTILAVQEGKTANIAMNLFSSVVPQKHGNIFIGFPTNQTTGLLCHVSAPSLIPTVERESIDLNARFISDWNYEVLRVAGIGCRIAYHEAMNAVKQKLARLSESQSLSDAVAAIMPDAIHVFKQFTLNASTPIEHVGTIVYNAFWRCIKDKAIDILSTQGVLPSNKVRLVSESLSFLSHLPVVPSEILSEAEGFVSQLFKNGLVSNMNIEDIEKELASRALTESELVEFLKWCASKVSSGALQKSHIETLFISTVVMTKSSVGPENTSPLPLATITTFLNISRISPEMPLPPITIPFNLSKGLTHPQLKSFGWEELHILPWLRFVLEASRSKAILPDTQNILLYPAFASNVLVTISKAWEQISIDAQAEVSELLRTHPVMPTTQGLKKPSESYLGTVKAFTDLPIVTVTNIKPRVLTALGVRTTVELDVVFKKLQGYRKDDKGDVWSPGEVIKYLASVMRDLPAEDMQRLRETPFCLSEQDPNTLHKVSALYVPKDSIKALGLKTIQLPFPFRDETSEGRLLKALGLKSFPPANVIVALWIQSAQNKNKDLYDAAMEYFLGNYFPNGYNKTDMDKISDVKYLPASVKEFPQLFAPRELYSSPKANLFDFLTLREDLRPHAEKFGVLPNPPADLCCQALRSHLPKTPQETRTMFAYLAERLSENDRNTPAGLGDAKIVPYFETTGKSETSRLVAYHTPKTVFIGRDREYKDLLTYVDFGQEANLFLLKVGSKHEPSILELVSIVAKDPGRWVRAQGYENYLDLLRKFADRKDQLESDRAFWATLKRTPFLLAATDRVSEKKSNSELTKESLEDDDYDDEKVLRDYTLEVAADTTVIDDVQHYMLFRDSLKTVPQEDHLEKFYVALGAQSLRSLVKESVRVGQTLKHQEPAHRLQSDIIERVRIFLYDYEREDPKRIRHNTKWLQDNLTVTAVDYILLHLTMKSASTSMKQTCHFDRRNRVLYITPKCDLFEVSRDLISVIINRPKKYEAVAFEQILSEPLKKLGRKGYNVERILRQKEYDARIAQSEREKQFEEEKARRAEAQQIEGQHQSSSTTGGDRGPPPPYRDDPGSPEPRMPGSFMSNSPERPDIGSNAVDNIRNTGQDIFKRFTKRFGLQGPEPPSNPSIQREPEGEPQPEPNVPRDPRQQQSLTKNNVNAAIQKCRPLDGPSLNTAARVTNVEESKGSYCDSTTEKDINFLEERGGYRCFISRQFDHSTDTELLGNIRASAADFGKWLSRLARVFQLTRGIHIFYDNHSNTIAFNSGGALFFNAYYYYSLHVRERTDPSQILEYWYLVFCHELAHNLVSEHSAAHSFYIQSICYEFRPAYHHMLQAFKRGE